MTVSRAVGLVELSPLLGETAAPEVLAVLGAWNARAETESAARLRGHSYTRPDGAGVTDDELAELLVGAGTVVLAPTAQTAEGVMRPPLDGVAAGWGTGGALLDAIERRRPDVHVVLVSHFLVGHGAAHRNATPQTWALRAIEARLRAGANPWTILRPTWLSTIHDADFRLRLTQDRHADGLVSTRSIADAVLAAAEHPSASTGVTAALYDMSVPGAPPVDLPAALASLERDPEAAATHHAA